MSSRDQLESAVRVPADPAGPRRADTAAGRSEPERPAEVDRLETGADGFERSAAELVELMVGYQAGDEACFDRLYDQLQVPLKGYLIALSKNRDLAVDLLQEVFLQLHRSRRTYRPPGSVKAWAFGIARNVYLMDRRRSVRRREDPLDDDAPPVVSLPSHEGRVVAKSTLEGALAELPLDQSEILYLRHQWGLSFAEIGGICGVSAGAVRVRAHRALKKLREAIDERP